MEGHDDKEENNIPKWRTKMEISIGYQMIMICMLGTDESSMVTRVTLSHISLDS